MSTTVADRSSTSLSRQDAKTLSLSALGGLRGIEETPEGVAVETLSAADLLLPTITAALELLDKLTRGDVTQAELRFIEGWTFRQLRARLDALAGSRTIRTLAVTSALAIGVGGGAGGPEQLHLARGTARHPARDRAVEGDDRRGLHRLERAIEQVDLQPVGLVGSFGPGMQRRDFQRLLRKHDVRPNLIMEFDNVETVKRAVEIDAGLARITPVMDDAARTRAFSLARSAARVLKAFPDAPAAKKLIDDVVALLLGPPLLYMLVVYLGSLGVLFVVSGARSVLGGALGG